MLLSIKRVPADNLMSWLNLSRFVSYLYAWMKRRGKNQGSFTMAYKDEKES